MKWKNSLRGKLTFLVITGTAAPLIGVVLLLVFWLMPTFGKQVSSNNQALANALATQTERALIPNQSALRQIAPNIAELQKRQHLQVALDTLVSSSNLFEAVYYVGTNDRIAALAVPPHAPIQRHDFIGLDLSGAPVLQRARKENHGVWSDAYRSPISSQSVVSTAVPAGDGLLIAELSLQNLSDFVRRLSDTSATLFILDRRGLVVAHPNPLLSAQQVNYSNLPIFEHGDGNRTEIFEIEGQKVIGTLVPVRDLDWHVIVTQPMASVQHPVLIIAVTLIALIVLGSLLAGWLSVHFARRLADRFEDLATLSQRLAAGDYPDQWPTQNLIEAERLNDSLRRLAEAIREREQALREINLHLEEKVAERTTVLREAEVSLARSEKLAALGSLVAGIAHELNTPIGNGLMAASAFQEHTKQFEKTVREGLRRSTLEQFIESSREASELIVRNLHRAGELISSFKQVSIDQSTSQRRNFELHELVYEIVTTLSPSIRKARCEVGIEPQEDIVMDSYPGPLGQVLINLISNAVVHGYHEQPGKVSVRMRKLPAGRAELSVSDDGHGIPPAVLGRIFDPFFTTKLGQGGSGLGLSICHTIVNNLLGGDIQVDSREGKGATFTLRIPLVAPVESSENNIH